MSPQRPARTFEKAGRAAAQKAASVDTLEMAAALFGHYCRSASFIEQDQERWMEAVQITPGEWVIKSLSCRIEGHHTDEPQQASISRRKVEILPLTETFSFMQALHKLYEFESGMRDRNTGAPALITAEELGSNHYIAFGQREGIAFDDSGKPLLTVKGHVVEMADISYEDMIAAREAWAEKERLFMHDTEELLPHFPLPIDQSHLDQLLIAMDNYGFVATLSERFDNCMKKFDDLTSAQSHFSLCLGEYLSKCAHFNDGINKHFEEIDTENDLDASALSEVRGKLQQYVLVMELHGYLYAAKKTFATRFKNGGDAGELKSSIMKDAAEIKSRYMALGHQPVSMEQIMADIIRLNQPHNHPLEARPKAFRLIKSTFEDMTERAGTIKEELRRQTLTAKDAKTTSNQTPQNPPGDPPRRQPIGSQIADMMMRYRK